MGAKVGGTGGAQSDINVTPLVDIVLVLLIIFMVITPLLAKNIPIEVPQKAELDDPPDEIKDQVVMKLFADGHVEINKQRVELDDVPKTIEEAMTGKTEKVLFFEGEDDAVYGNAVALMDMAKGAGAVTLGIMTPSDEPPPGFGPTIDGGEAPAAPAAPE